MDKGKPLTQKGFERLLTKAAQQKKSDSGASKIAESRHDDGYSGKRKSQGKTEGKEG